MKLKYLADTLAGGTPAVENPLYWTDSPEGIAWISIGDMSDRGQVEATGRRVTMQGIEAARLPVLGAGTLLLSMYASLGHTALTTEWSTWNQAILGIVPRSGSSPQFLKYALESIRPRISEFARSNTQSNLNAEQVRNLTLPRPSSEEQRRIADFLDAETSRIDRLVELRRRQIESLAERSRAITSEVLVPGILSESRGRWPWPWLPDLPDDRPLVRLGYVCRIQNGLTVDGKRQASADWVTRPYLRVANVQAGYVDLGSITEIAVSRDVAARTALRQGDVLMTEGGDLDKLGRGTVWHGEIDGCLHQNHVFALRPERGRLDGEFLALMTQTLHGRCYFESTGVKTTNLASTNSSKILGFPIPLPCIEKQRVLAAQVANAQLMIGNAVRVLERQHALLSERRQAIITAAVTGQFDVATASGRNTIQGV
ncbi:hypothetical protein FOH10_07405 [Nocardia otitidiscaviarum]|uniref:Type I restriction modification DNA specificity domain-containing protein n=1 Tax=Nocardia otitidiscaviarum TaxID=1823 RepID=A0A516NI64_9NOCA|nr:restriction endonuclease subunit S [Nocardia otitidiscaviarum]MCP9619925.1 restriction endonuclease subunit S [Nocardia otitidiscaviarum]QDP78592.1 hypothetical protein FOH10_07405 [Nocardia otitidiscaviarum]